MDTRDSKPTLFPHLPRLRPRPSRGPRLSVVVPAYEERSNLDPLYAAVVDALGDGDDWELVLVDDGSRDGSAAHIRELAARDPRVFGVFLGENRGQSAAIAAGVQLASGELIATIDADLQNDPHDLPALVARLGDHDAVVGYRVQRRDNLVRRLSSRIANAVRNRVSGDSIRDTGCGTKVFRAEAIRSIPWFRGAHRFLPTLLRQHGFSVIEHGVAHHPRHSGKSKYGVRNRALRSLVDLLGVRWIGERVLDFPIAGTTETRDDTIRPQARPRPAGSPAGEDRPAAATTERP